MKYKSIILALLFVIGIADGYSRVLPGQRDVVSSETSESTKRKAESEEKTYMPTLIKIDDEDEISQLEADGVEIWRRRGNILLALVPRVTANKLKAKQPERRIELGRKNYPALDKALSFNNAFKILTGEGFSKDYQGRGVVVGICDIGFDPVHPAFMSADGKTSRIRKLTHYEETKGIRNEMTTIEEYAAWKTDDADARHATHVAGILAGACDSEGYRGVAAEADIVISVSECYDVGLLCGAEDIIDYAKEQGKPCVINISMGNYTGPHDGTSLFSQYVDLMAEDAVVCLSAGNEGARNNALRVKFSDTQKEMKYRLANYRWTQFDMYGYTDLWSSTSQNIKIQPVVYDEYHQKILYELPEIEVTDGTLWGVTTTEPVEYEIKDETLSEYFNGWLAISGEIWPDNNRMNVLVQYDMHTTEVSPAGPWAIYNLAFIVKGENGAVIDCYADGVMTFLKPMPGTNQKPSPYMSISDLACGKNVISVGMHNTRGETPSLGAGVITADNIAGIVNPNSSYGTLDDGRVMPLTVAPGADIISACSLPWLEAHPDQRDYCAASGKWEYGDYYWTRDCGTSMASPYVAGFIACMMEVNPLLKISDVQSIIAKSNRHDYSDEENPRHGQGWFDPISAMAEVQRGIQVNVVDAERPTINILLDKDRIIVNGEGELVMELYSANGILLKRLCGVGQFSCSKSEIFQNGIGIVKASDNSGVVVKKIK